MRIIITKLGPGASVRDVMAFLRSGATSRLGQLFGDPPRVENCRIVKIVDDDTGDLDYVALARITPEKAALKAIKKLNLTRLRGRVVQVREYVYRSRRNDRRRREYPVNEEHDRRENDRRRPNLRFEKETGSAKVEGMKDFTRTYGQ